MRGGLGGESHSSFEFELVSEENKGEGGRCIRCWAFEYSRRDVQRWKLRFGRCGWSAPKDE